MNASFCQSAGRDHDVDGVETLRRFIAGHERIFILTGAGCSTPSGIPDYRDARGAWKRPQPVHLRPFLDDPDVRRRYWARSLLGWPHFARAEPNAAHRAIAALEQRGQLSSLVTQNVDGLHQRAGHRGVLDLHGRIDVVECLACHRTLPRADLQQTLADLNPEFAGQQAAAAPDGDAMLESADFSRFRVPACSRCGGLLKPSVVFFGEAVPAFRVTRAYEGLEAADAVLFVGTSLMVYSGFRFARRAAELGLPIAAINIGATRADAMLDCKLEADCADALPRLIAS